MRFAIIVLSFLVTACELDLSSLPECEEDIDCDRDSAHAGDLCVAHTCVASRGPTATDDVFYIRAGDTHVEGDVIANDADPEGDPLVIYAVDMTLGAQITSDHTISIEAPSDLSALPIQLQYQVQDTVTHQVDTGSVVVAALPASVSVPVFRGQTIVLADALRDALKAPPSSVAVIASPGTGLIAGADLATTYTAPTDSCAPAMATLALGAANGTFEVDVTFDIQLELHYDTADLDFGTTSTVDVLANDGAAPLTITGAQTTAGPSGVTVAPDGSALLVEPPVDAVATYTVVYTAQDTTGCTGSAIATIKSGFPTSVFLASQISYEQDPVISGDGRYIAFTSSSSTLVWNDTNGKDDVFVLDVETGTFERISVAADGGDANDYSGSPSISSDGRYVAFVSAATNLVAADSTPDADVYLRDRVAGTTVLVSVSTTGGGSNGAAWAPQLSANGGRVVFGSTATNLVAADTNGANDVFVRDIAAGTTKRVSVTDSGGQAQYGADAIKPPRISGDGQFVAFASLSSLDEQALGGGTFLVNVADGSVKRLGISANADLDDSGRYVVYSTSTLRLYDRVLDTDVDLGFAGQMPSFAADGRSIAFTGSGTVMTYAIGSSGPVESGVLHDGTSAMETPNNGRAEISDDGRWIVFASFYWPGYFQNSVIVRVWNRAYTPP